jgi:hypothetical protein
MFSRLSRIQYSTLTTMRPSVPDVHITDSQDAEQAAYRPLAWQTVLGLVFGLFAPLAMLGPGFWAIPVLGGFVNWRSLGRIKKSHPPIAGRRIAMWGLALSLMFLAAAPTDWSAYRWMICQEARQFSGLWFKYLTQDEPQKAFQLTVRPDSRQPLDDNLWAFYRNGPRSREELEKYVSVPVVRKLLALGPKALVRFYETTLQTRTSAIMITLSSGTPSRTKRRANGNRFSWSCRRCGAHSAAAGLAGRFFKPKTAFGQRVGSSGTGGTESAKGG